MYFKENESCMELKCLTRENMDNSNEPFLPTLFTPWMYEFVLVAKKNDDEKEITLLKQMAFIEELKRKNMSIKEIKLDNKVFYGICAPREIFQKYKYLLKVSDTCNGRDDHSGTIPQSTRIRIVNFILFNTFINTGENLDELLKKGVFEVAFCLHEGQKQKDLTKKWARWSAICKSQPVDDIRKYFGEKIALYYLWLGWYTMLLVPAAILGLIVFLYGLAFFNTSPLIKEVCQADILMCPRCDKTCKVWHLSDTCMYAKVSHLFDNEGTVAFAMFMAVWATLFLELWKRHRSLCVSKWNVFDWCEEEEEIILEILNDFEREPKPFRHSYLRSTGVLVLATLILVMIIGLAQALVVFRVMANVLLSEGTWDFLKDNANTIAVMMGSVVHYLTIVIMTRVNKIVAFKICEIEETRSFAATERSFTIKMFTFQFFTLFSSLIYVAFFLGRINGHPGNYVRIAGKWRLEECHPSGCLTDLFIQMAIIMVLKQTLNNIVEFTVPWFKRCFKMSAAKKLERKCGHCYKKTFCNKEGSKDPCDICTLRDWLKNYNLNDVNAFSLFNEFLEMVIQFSFTTIFVAAFPLAPLLALLNNVFEIRLDAIKMVTLERRLVPKKTNDIGVWTNILQAVGVLAVIANGLIIGISSDFIPRLVYRYRYGPCANGTANNIHCMTGYVNDTLSTAYVTNENVRLDFAHHQLMTHSGFNITQCSYKDYRNPDDHTLTSQYWLILALRFAFVILFEHVLVICKFIAAWFVDDNPTAVNNLILQDKYKRLREEYRNHTHTSAV